MMRIRRLRTILGTLCCITGLTITGCHSAPQQAGVEVKVDFKRADEAEEARRAAEASLGKEAEILAHGDLAQNGREQVLVVNRFSTATAGAGGTKPTAIFVTRAAILEKYAGKWSQVLLCDEHLKNPNGYLGGSPTTRVSGWRLEFDLDAKEGLTMKFTPAERFDAENGNANQNSAPEHPSFEVRWNKNAKRYQSFDQSHERYLSEVPSLETPQSILK
jgi:hypothetical protein